MVVDFGMIGRFMLFNVELLVVMVIMLDLFWFVFVYMISGVRW